MVWFSPLPSAGIAFAEGTLDLLSVRPTHSSSHPTSFWAELALLAIHFFFFFREAIFSRFPYLDHSFKSSLLVSIPVPRALHTCVHQGLVLDYRTSSPWVIQVHTLQHCHHNFYTNNSQMVLSCPKSSLGPHFRKSNHK